MPNVKKAMRTPKPTKDDPAGTRFIGGKKLIPYTKTPAPKIKYPKGTAGKYSAPVDTTGMDPEMIGTLGIKRKK